AYANEPQDQKARADPYYAELDRIADRGGSMAILEVIEQKKKAPHPMDTDFLVVLQWLKDRVRGKRDPDPFYALHYSDLLFEIARAHDRNGDEDAPGLFSASYIVLRMFEAVAVTDAARCDDVTVNEPVHFLVVGRYARFRDLMDRIPPATWPKAK